MKEEIKRVKEVEKFLQELEKDLNEYSKMNPVSAKNRLFVLINQIADQAYTSPNYAYILHNIAKSLHNVYVTEYGGTPFYDVDETIEETIKNMESGEAEYHIGCWRKIEGKWIWKKEEDKK